MERIIKEVNRFNTMKFNIMDDRMRLKDDVNVFDYDYIIVAFSGGKDSTACILHLLDLGVPTKKIELWHHLVDGRSTHLVDWPVTEAYVRHFTDELGLRLFYSWRERGFEGELLKENRKSLPILFETPEGPEQYMPQKAQITSIVPQKAQITSNGTKLKIVINLNYSRGNIRVI